MLLMTLTLTIVLFFLLLLRNTSSPDHSDVHYSDTIDLRYNNINLSPHVSNINASERLSDSDARTPQYVVTLEVDGQQGAGIHAIVSLQHTTASTEFSVKILEPILIKTQYAAFEMVHKNTSTSSVRFSHLFNLQHYNYVSKKLGHPLVISREEFFASAHKKVLYVIMRPVYGVKKPIVNVFWTSRLQSHKAGNDKTCYFDNKLRHLLQYRDYCVVKVIEVMFSGNIPAEQIHPIIYGESPKSKNLTIIFSEWRHYWNRFGKVYKELLRPSQKLLTDARYYEDNFLNSRNKVAVMIRIEHLLDFVQHPPPNETHHNWTVEKCLIKAVQVATALHSNGRAMLTADIGKYGSGTLNDTSNLYKQKLNQLTDKTFSLLAPLIGNTSTSFKTWEDSFTVASRGVCNSAYIAALQRTIASRARCLVLVGGGTFQRLSLNDYLNNHPNKEEQCIKVVCATRGVKKF